MKTMQKVFGFLLLAIFVLGMSFGSTSQAEAKSKKSKKNNPRADVVLTFDDGESNLYGTVRPILKKYGVPGTAFIVSDWVGEGNHVTLPQLQKMQGSNWEFGNHTRSHSHLTEISKDKVKEQICGAQDWFTSNGLKVHAFAPPYGEYNGYTKDVVASCGLTSLRYAWTEKQPFNYRDHFNDMNIEVISVKKGTSLNALKDYIKQAESEAMNRGDDVLVVFVIHGVVKNPSDHDQMSVKNLTNFAKFLKSERKAKRVNLGTMSPEVDKFLH